MHGNLDGNGVKTNSSTFSLASKIADYLKCGRKCGFHSLWLHRNKEILTVEGETKKKHAWRQVFKFQQRFQINHVDLPC